MPKKKFLDDVVSKLFNIESKFTTNKPHYSQGYTKDVMFERILASIGWILGSIFFET